MRSRPATPRNNPRLADRRVQATMLLVLCLAIGGCFSLHLGQDTNWDLQNYHFYNAWSFLHARLTKDLFAAAIETYFSPILDLPYYWLSTGPLQYHPRLMAFLMGLPFGFLLFFSFQISWTVSKAYMSGDWIRIPVCLTATGFGCSGIADVVQVGTTFNEVTLGALALAGLWLLLLHAEHPRVWHRRSYCLMLGSGLLIGAAAALKFTAGIYAPAAGLICLLLPGGIGRRLARATLFSLGWMAMLVILWVPRAMLVYRMTGNPLFPMFNNIFQSSWAPAIGGRDMHALPTGIVQAIFFPFYWIKQSWVVLENPFSDPRYAVVFISVVLLLIVGTLRKLTEPSGKAEQSRSLDRQDTAVYLVLYFVITYVIWEALFSLLRYTAGLESLSGAVVLIACGSLYRFVRFPYLAKVLSIASLVLIAAAAMVRSQYPSYGRVPYGKTMWNIDAPAVPAGSTIILGDFPTAFVAPFIASHSPGVSFVGLPVYIGVFAGFDIGKQIRARIADAFALYIVIWENRLPPLGILADFGLEPDFPSCREIASNISPGLSICAAQRIAPASAAISGKFRIEPIQISPSSLIDLSMTFSESCTDNAGPRLVTMRYAAQSPVDGIRVYTQSLPGPRTEVALPPNTGVAKLGQWVAGGQRYFFTDLKGNALGAYVLRYAPCN